MQITHKYAKSKFCFLLKILYSAFLVLFFFSFFLLELYEVNISCDIRLHNVILSYTVQLSTKFIYPVHPQNKRIGFVYSLLWCLFFCNTKQKWQITLSNLLQINKWTHQESRSRLYILYEELFPKFSVFMLTI